MLTGKRYVIALAALVLTAGFAGVGAARTATSRSVNSGGELAFEEVARRFCAWIESEESRGGAPSSGALERVLREELVWLDLGLFEVGLPGPALASESGVSALRRACDALVRAQQRWLEWRDPVEGAKGELAADLERIAAWIGGWNPKSFASPGSDEAPRPVGLPEGDEELQAAVARAAGALRGAGRAPRLVLMPERAAFIEFLCFCGWARPDLRRHYWVSGIETWTNFFVEDIQVYALEYASVDGGADYRAATAMDARTPTGIEQHVAALAMTKLLDHGYGDALPGSFVTGLGSELVIDLFGEVDTRVDGDLSAKQTQAREVFVPGGASEGGILPQHDADSRWRVDQGRFHFTRVLRGAQKRATKAKDAGGTPAREKHANFALRDAGERNEWIVSAPFLGPQAATELPASPFHGDYVEFLRAYRIAFVHWLRNEAGGSERASRAAFASLLERLAQPGSGGLVEALEATYERPLSDASAGRKTLEGSFLRWVSKQRGA